MEPDPSGAKPLGERPAPREFEVPAESVGEALATFRRVLTKTTAAYVRMLRRPKDVSFHHVTQASVERVTFAFVGVLAAVAASWRRRAGRTEDVSRPPPER